ncbi:MAG: serine/threonine protein kinase, partial [Planctomycetota bacterium]
ATALGPTPSPDSDPLLGEVIGGCQINAKIGQGGMGAIYLARHTALQKDVVVKILPPESAANPRTVERFFREARAAARLEHPNIVQVQDVNTTERGLHYIVMQYIDGENLEEKIRRDGRHSVKDAVNIVLQVARGLKAAHEAEVIHRDIKAENILVTNSGTVKVTDFGLAKDLNSELKLTADGAMIGTPLYMAPEIGRVKEIDGRVDIYSLGVTFYYLLTGIQPFRGFSALEILSAKAHDQLKPPEEHIPDIEEPVRNVLGKMLEKDRDMRYRNVDELMRDLEALDRGLPVEAPPPSIWPPSAGPAGSTRVTRRKRGTTARARERERKGKPAKQTGVPPLLILGLAGAGVLVIALIVVLVVLVSN